MLYFNVRYNATSALIDFNILYTRSERRKDNTFYSQWHEFRFCIGVYVFLHWSSHIWNPIVKLNIILNVYNIETDEYTWYLFLNGVRFVNKNQIDYIVAFNNMCLQIKEVNPLIHVIVNDAIQ